MTEEFGGLPEIGQHRFDHAVMQQRAHGCALEEAAVLELLGMDIELNAQGLEVWLDRARRHARHG